MLQVGAFRALFLPSHLREAHDGFGKTITPGPATATRDRSVIDHFS